MFAIRDDTPAYKPVVHVPQPRTRHIIRDALGSMFMILLVGFVIAAAFVYSYPDKLTVTKTVQVNVAKYQTVASVGQKYDSVDRLGLVDSWIEKHNQLKSAVLYPNEVITVPVKKG